jgi:predicted aspartyl protease
MFQISAVLMLAMAAVPESTCSTGASSPVTASVVPFEWRQESRIVVPLYLDGTGPWRFLVDTGSSRSAISEALAAKIGMPLVAQTALATDGRTSMRPVARLTNLAVGCARAQALLAPTLSPADVRQLGAGIVGVLGQDFLSRFSYTLDYRANLLVWDLAEDGRDEAPVRDARRVRLPLREEEDGRFVVDLSGTRFVPASAVDGIVLFAGAGTNRFLANAAAQPGDLVPLDNRRAARLVMLKRLQIGAAALWDVPAVVMFGPDGTEGVPDGDGLLPLSLFARVTFNPRQGYVEIEPR